MTWPLSTIDPDKAAEHPLTSCKREWCISHRSFHSDDLIVLHDIQPPDEIDVCRETHHTLFCNLIDSPQQVTRIADQEYQGPMKAGELFLMPARHPSFNAWETTNEAIIFLLTPAFLQRTADQTGCLINPDHIELRPVLIDQDPQIEKIARLFYSEMQTEGFGDRLYSESLANCLAIHLLRNYSTATVKLDTYEGGLSPQRLQQATDFIQAHLDEKITLTSIAQHLNLSVHYFCQLFAQSTGMPPYRYVLRQRIERAKQLLKTKPDSSLGQIALECGFANQSHFTNHFRKLTGITPRGYRQQL